MFKNFLNLKGVFKFGANGFPMYKKDECCSSFYWNIFGKVNKLLRIRKGYLEGKKLSWPAFAFRFVVNVVIMPKVQKWSPLYDFRRNST